MVALPDLVATLLNRMEWNNKAQIPETVSKYFDSTRQFDKETKMKTSMEYLKKARIGMMLMWVFCFISFMSSSANSADQHSSKDSRVANPSSAASAENIELLKQSKKNWEELKRDRAKMIREKTKKTAKIAQAGDKKEKKSTKTMESEKEKRNQIEKEKFIARLKKAQAQMASYKAKSGENVNHE